MKEITRLVGNTLIGADPEIFIVNKNTGKVVGSERVIPEGKNIVVRDGIQVEFNPPASVNARVLSDYIKHAFNFANGCLRNHPELTYTYDTVVDVDRAELDSLSEKSRVLGCEPSKNVHGTFPITVDPKTYTLRSAGGHLHFGLTNDALFDDRVRLINWLDVFVGLPCVLLDRDKKAAVRRENYGRAGEYRLQPHGIEYRTLSNFWLQAPSLIKFVVEQANIALAVVADGINGGDLESRLIDIVDNAAVIKAINTNDLALATSLLVTLHSKGFFFKDSTVGFQRFRNISATIEKNGSLSLFKSRPHDFKGRKTLYALSIT